MFEQCIELVSHSKVKVKENKRKAIFNNEQRSAYQVIRIDNCVVKEGIRMDFLVCKEKTFSALVELKGRGVERACEQLFASAEHPNVKPLLNPQVGFLIVCSKHPRFDTYVAKAKQHAARKYRAGLHVFCDAREVDMEKIVKIAS